MKIFKLILVSAVGLSGYLGYTTYEDFSFKKVKAVLRPMESVSPSIEGAGDAAKARARPAPLEEEDGDYSDLIVAIGKALLPLLAPVLAAKRKKQPDGTVLTLDDSVGKLAENMGVSRAFIRGRLGLGDRRKKQSTTKRKRRATD